MKKLLLINPAFLFLVGMLFFGCQEAVDLNEPTAEKVSSNRLYCVGNGGCTNTPGYWKNHPEDWPVDELTLGGVDYDKSQLLQILNQPVRGNGLVILAKALIAAELSIENGADPEDVEDARADAHALIDGRSIPPFNGGYLKPNLVSGVAEIIDEYIQVLAKI